MRTLIACLRGQILPQSRPALSDFSEPQNRWIGEIYVVLERRAADFEAFKVMKGLVGIHDCLDSMSQVSLLNQDFLATLHMCSFLPHWY